MSTKTFFVLFIVVIFVGVTGYLIWNRGHDSEGADASSLGLATATPSVSTKPGDVAMGDVKDLIKNNNAMPSEPRTLEGGLKVQDTVIGTGEEAKAGMAVAVHYTGTLADGKKFDSSLDRGQPFQFILGQGMVIRGWDVGVAGMKVGGKRTLIIPPAMGYGEAGAGDAIPPNATLTFTVELLAVQAM